MARTGDHLPLWRRARRRAYWLLLLGLLGLADRCPVWAGRGVCVALARLALRIRPRDRSRAESNLRLAFPQMEPRARAELLRCSTEALGRNLFDSLAAGRILDTGSVVEERRPGGGDASLADVLARLGRKGRGVFILTGHVGCWELLGAYAAREVQAAQLGQLAVVTGTLHNEPLNRVVQTRRRQLGMKVVPREEGARPLLAHLKTGGVAAVLLDQNTDVRSLAAPFFGHPARTPAGLASLALKYGIPVLPLGLARTSVGHEVRWLPALEQAPALGEVSEFDLRNFLTRCNLQLETLIRRNPAEWVWFHNRWETAEPERTHHRKTLE